MKKFFITLVLIFSVALFTEAKSEVITPEPTESYDDFCDGWKDGWKAGYCYPNDNCMAGITPMCPSRRIGETSYKHGYNRGFLVGRKAGR